MIASFKSKRLLRIVAAAIALLGLTACEGISREAP